jgi:hypothetical protein
MGLDPNYIYDNADVIWYGTNTYADALGALMKITGKSEEAVTYMLNGQYGAADYYTAIDALRDNGVITAKNTNGYNCFAYADKVTETYPTGPMYQMNSNATATTTVKAAPAYDTVIDDVAGSATEGKVLTNPMGSLLTPEHGFYGWKFFAGECLQAVGAASVGITLGKTIDSALYNLNPDFWDANGMKSLDPTTWNSITNGDDSFAAGLFNTIIGLDPNTGNGQMFMDENAFAYLAMWMASQGIFAAGNPTYEVTNLTKSHTYDGKIYATGAISLSFSQYGVTYNRIINTPVQLIFRANSPSSNTGDIIGATSNSNVRYQFGTEWNPNASTYRFSSFGDVYYNTFAQGVDISSVTPSIIKTVSSSDAASLAWDCIHGTVTQTSGGGVDGIGNQEGATLPNTTNWNTPQNTLTDLKGQYPSLWDNAVPNTVVQPDGTTKTITYVPVAMPNANGQWDAQPTSSTSSQANPQVQPQPNPTPENNDLLKLLLQLLTMPEPNPEAQPEPQPQPQPQPQPPIPDTPTTGDGSSPTPIPPTGSASALWAVYHPTQAQVNAFGAWLWSSNFVDQLLKVFQNPMEAIISLHKVFIMPIDAGNTTIHAGYLDSGVSSAYVTQQYVYADCGSVDCMEYFGNVFDYVGTNASLYLPFIGIVPLNINEVMRSTISVKYGCDLFTGAILVEVNISRDGNNVIMYQYGGDGGVQYPVSGSRSGGFLTGLAATIGAAASVATGGAALPAFAAALGGSVMSAQKQVQHSGGFSGNSGAMGCKIPYLIIERPQTKVASLMPSLDGYPTNYSVKLSDCSGQVVVSSVHIEGINATENELKEIERLLKAGILV